MGQLTTLTFDEGRHRYTLDGKPVQGVTTIIGNGLPKPGLTWWAAKVVAETAVHEIDRLRTDVECGRSEAAVQWLKRTPFAERDRAAAGVGHGIPAGGDALQADRTQAQGRVRGAGRRPAPGTCRAPRTPGARP